MDKMSSNQGQNVVLAFLKKLKSSHLAMLLGGLFLVDLFVPDPIPFLDEAVLLGLTILASQWKTRHEEPPPPPPKPPPKNVTPNQNAP